MKTRFPLVRFARVPGRRFGDVVFFLAVLLCVTTLPVLAAGPAARFSGSVATLNGGFSGPYGVAIDGSNNVYVADLGDNAVKVMPTGCASSGCVTTLGSGFSHPTGVAVDGSGKVYVADFQNNAVKGIPAGCTSSSCVTTLGGGFNQPEGLAVDGSGNVYVADTANHAVKKIPLKCASSSCVTTLGGGFSLPAGVAVDGSGNVYVADFNNNAVKVMPAGCASSSCVTTLGGGFHLPAGVAVDGSGMVYVADYANNAVKMMAAGCASSSCVTTLGSGFSYPTGVAVDGSGKVYVADFQNNAVKTIELRRVDFGSVPVSSAGAMRSLTYSFTAGGTIGSPTALMLGAPKLDFAVASGGSCTSGINFNAGDTCTVNVTFAPRYAGQRNGAVQLTDSSGMVIGTAPAFGVGTAPQAVFSPGAVSLLGGGFAVPGGGFSLPSGVAIDGSGNVYVADTDNSAVKKIPAGCVSSSCVITLWSGLQFPFGVAVDGGGNVYVADTNNNAVKEMPAGCGSSSCVMTLGGGFYLPHGVAIDGSGNVYVADYANKVVKEMPAGCASSNCVTTLGGSGFNGPIGVAVDGIGNIYVADYTGNAVKKMPAGCASSSCVTARGGWFNGPTSVAVDGIGNAYVADRGRYAVKEIPPTCASSSCVVTLGSGFDFPTGVAVDGSGNVYVADEYNHSVPEIERTSPPGLTFASTATGSTSNDSPRTVTVTNIGNAPLTFPTPSSSGTYNPSVPANFRYDEGSSCLQNGAGSATPFTLPAGDSCTVAIAFTPTTAGSSSGAVVLTDDNLNAAGPNYTGQEIPLQGGALVSVAALDFTIEATGSQSQTVASGHTAGFSFQIGPTQVAYPAAVSLTATGLPQGATASFSPSTIAASDGTKTVTMTIQTQAASTTAKNGSPFDSGVAPLALGLLLFPLLGFRCVRKPLLERSMMVMVLFATSLAGIALLTGCGGSNSVSGQAAKSYTVTVTASGGGVQHSVDVSLNVQ